MAMKNNGFCADIQAGLPSLSAETQNEFIPQALNLQAIEQAISFTKGCYIGQETVARAKYRGANKRAMYVLSGETTVTPKIGSEIEMQLETAWRKNRYDRKCGQFWRRFMVTRGDE